MRIEIDQSGKIEDTARNTVIAFSNTDRKSICISSADKRTLQKIFRQKGKHKVFVYQLFALLIFLLIKSGLRGYDSIIIDVEYEGKESLIKSFLVRYCSCNNAHFDKTIVQFRRIGKGSPAHAYALDVLRRKRAPDTTATIEEILPYFV
ncbi:MAG: hypothetical protein UW39_C0005G0033 [Parcubacteria group bacterium GW2011_GWC2_44_17]|uniref:Uncharacterized protein n=1 Tax=Candidatus Jacksonbacteria bacterium RIFCSPLOWO2_02_FULL_44_20 TaxID=1798460 RepID=A0A1G2ADE6_9BACT|nr:MAG: hypothetical protein UW39_C0005G0033 [Parcubacteria group bacterium GW2011_GWC2_44_17]KKT49302.1 MAG: hypothetical protein UW40_C0023G0022 [Parcubacteria group bacterium GW2011_GWF2_44_17]OGY71719.1 MAG: hypothetical protein A3E05_03280 [Candidatus Jacksonbacteria bacterium RIFCSPHIGHO2_12_FULL_44_12]OGY71879.1 MAG: hypothetical protein A3C00_01085 [Candidatus Jacksonbacteria bacterium RIFCSPHIGHO2_02_FULL_44_25]OGY73533.1 MAG: hypothetical protein A3H07_03810 [Candidatus Jacksonbacteri